MTDDEGPSGGDGRPDEERRVEVVERAARAGAEAAATMFRDGITGRTKDRPGDVVTDADHAAQERAVEVLSAAFPEDPVIGEEEGLPGEVPESGPGWVIDPIDGTNNYVRDLGLWATSVAAIRDGDPVAAATVLPVLDETYVSGYATGTGDTRRNGQSIEVNDRGDLESATVAPISTLRRSAHDRYLELFEAVVRRCYDVRRLGSAQFTLSLVAAGTLDAAIAIDRLRPWDTIAGVDMIRRAGGVVTDLEGDRWRHDSGGLVASNGVLHDDLLAVARE